MQMKKKNVPPMKYFMGDVTVSLPEPFLEMSRRTPN